MVGEHPAVKSVIPGRIKSTIRGSKTELQYKYPTTSGLKYLAKSSGGVQEIFIVTGDTDSVIEHVQKVNESV